MIYKKKHIILLVGILFVFLLISILLSTIIGSVKLPIDLTLKILLNHLPFLEFDQVWTSGQEAIIWDLRMPRIILAIIIGAMLSLSGVVFQGVLKNPLADPYILGVSSGAALGAAIAILFFNQGLLVGKFTISLFAFIGGLLSLSFIFFIANTQLQQKSETIILAGVIAQSLGGAMLSFLIAISGDQMQSIIFWMMGSFANTNWLDVWVILPYFIIGTVYIFAHYKELNIMALGDRAAFHLGVDVNRSKYSLLFVASLLAAAAVSLVGIIGFVGLVIPHLVRLVTGPNHQRLLPVAMLTGAIFLLWADTLARTVLPSRELPIGVITAFIGAPFFAYLLKRYLRRGT